MTIPLEISGAAAVLTGAGSGIGRAAALSLGSRGARVVASDVDADRAAQTAALIREAGGDATSIRVDVSDQGELESLRDLCLATYGRLDIVMNNVGVLAMGPAETMPIEAWQRVVELNLLSIARSNLVFLPHLISMGRGHVVNTASASGLLAYGFDRLPYVATKHAVVGITEALAIYLGPKGIGTTLVCPSGVITNILDQITVYGQPGGAPRAPQHPLVEAPVVGELVADAIASGRFMVVTAPEIHDELRQRAADVETYIQNMIRSQTDG